MKTFPRSFYFRKCAYLDVDRRQCQVRMDETCLKKKLISNLVKGLLLAQITHLPKSYAQRPDAFLSSNRQTSY